MLSADVAGYDIHSDKSVSASDDCSINTVYVAVLRQFYVQKMK